MAGLSLRLGLGLQRPASGGGAGPLLISGAPATTATDEQPYAGFDASASGGVAPYSYSLVGTWPAGISINSSTGAVSGTPTEAGSFASLSVRVTDAETDTADLDSFTLVVSALPSGPTVNADHVFVRDITAGSTLYGKAPDTQCDYPASVTKLMTALIVLRNKRSALSDTVTVQSGDLLSASYSQMGLLANDVITFTDLLHGMLLPSGGDACQAAARIVGDLLTASGGVARFVTEMNTVADELGMAGTSYANTWGFAEANHYSTARDVGLLMEEVLSEPALSGILDKSVYSATITGANARTIFMSSSNPILEDEGVIGGKTGTWIDTTPDPDINVYNLANAWQAPNGNTIVVVTLQSDTGADRQDDQRDLIAQLPTDYPYLATTTGNGEGFVLLEDGASRVLLEDGSSRVLLEG
ncbi:putative Ig domain-containing protein [Sinorhizobium americanum]|uniref:Putative Ig domain-containing protein n=1 Tax=Sinorhizobium americanum TaxID=194963 RepID=A0A4R2BTV2_9HYPH|nr:putative Ig domain-containing protein [Sinorhizobium americanum]TCN30355.1 putative Ig domain-containing protein [Sinorhizobium americanum]